ncbi:MAG TPA: S53 family peptidase, partial [Rhizomicrobium sp.]|nr:S53 family peptidase [Rhizomicrobium sp.]
LTKGLLSAFVMIGFASAANAQEVEHSGGVYHRALCGQVAGLAARCHAHVVTDAAGRALDGKRGERVAGYGPADLNQAYNITTQGSSSTIVAIVDAFGYDNAEADLQTYRNNFGLPTCTTANGCFKKLNQKGKPNKYPAQDTGWAAESALDMDMVSAMCPNCKIYLIEAKTNSLKNLAAAAAEAGKLGAHVISNSYGGGDSKGTKKFDPSYAQAGVAVTASTGDHGFAAGPQYPATSPGVIAVGGTHMVRDAGSPRGFDETVWSGAGSGCSTVWAKPSWQTDPGCSKRMEADVSAVADPSTGVAVFGPHQNGVSGWQVFGGTSVSAPLVGGIFGNANGAVNAASTIYAHTANLNDVTSGNNGTCSPAYFCTGEVGYDGPTGMGTPNGLAAFGN